MFTADETYYAIAVATSVTRPSINNNHIIPNGAVCVGTGSYQLDHNLVTSVTEPVNISPAVCILPPPPEREEHMAVRLGLVCSGGMVEMTWNTSLTSFRHTTNITLHTTCLNSQRTVHEVYILYC